MPHAFNHLVAVELHNFSDASEKGYAAVSHLRLVDVDKNVHCSFVMAKTRLSPLKTITIPRLELTAAVLAVQLSQVIQAELPLNLTKVVYWTDSTSVIQYVKNESKRFHTFVANRIAKIRNATLPSQWFHVGSEENPVDEGLVD